MLDVVTLEFLAQQLDKILAALADARAERLDDRADNAVLLATLQRLDASIHGLTAEVRALLCQL